MSKIAGNKILSLLLAAMMVFTMIPLTVLAAEGDAQVNVIYVVQSGSGDGSSWGSAMGDVQAAIEAAASSGGAKTQVWITAGTYTPNSYPNGGSNARENHFSLRNGVTVIGGFAGTEETATPTGSATIFSGDIGTAGDDSDNTYHVFYHPDGTGLDATAVLKNVTISGGIANDTHPHNYGGGMYNYNSSPTLTNCAFTENSANYGGGGMSNIYSSPTLADCAFTENSASVDGGGMYNINSSPTLADCVFTKNNAGQHGGGMTNANSNSTLTDCTFIENSASSGGGMANGSGGSPTLIGCDFTENSADYDGGGMYNNDSSLTLADCDFTDNSAYNGGGMLNAQCGLTLTDCAFTENSADNDGGGMHNALSSEPALADCTFTGNSADNDGGGMYNTDSNPTLMGCAFTGNSADRNGGGMYNAISSEPALTDCTFTGNSTKYLGGGMYNSASSPTLSNCLFTGNSTTMNNSSSYKGGGIYNTDGSNSTLTGCTLTGNSAGQYGGGMYIRNDGSTADISHTVICGNTTTSGNYLDIIESGGGTESYAYSIIGTTKYGADKFATSSLSEAPEQIVAANGSLPADSPAIDAGNNTAYDSRWTSGSPSLWEQLKSAGLVSGDYAIGKLSDIAGNPRLRGATVDIGAYESAASVLDPSATVGDVTISGTTGSAISGSATITITNEALAAALSSTDVSSWFGSSLPAGVTVSADGTNGGTIITLAFNGAPTSASSAVFDITIPALVLTGNAALTVTANANAKFAITAAGGDTLVMAEAIGGVTSPVAGETPSTAIINGTDFNAALSWDGTPATFDYSTAYTATITLAAASGYTFSGGFADTAAIAGFTVNGIAPVWVSNSGSTLVFTVTFPATGSASAPTVGSVTAPAAVNEGQALTLNAPSVSGESITAQGWQISADGSDGWAGFDTSTTMTASHNGQYLRYYATNGDGTAYSLNTVQITVSHAPGAAATCTTPQTCTECNAELEAALGHDMPATWTERTPPTCGAAGVEYMRCSRYGECSHEVTQPIAALSHTWITDGNGTHHCATEGGCATANETCSPNNVGNTCDKCWYVTPDPVCPHTDTTTGFDPAPTCTTGGAEVVTCDDCHGTISAGTVPALGHDLPAAWTVRTAAACTAAGVEYKACRRDACDHEITQAITALGHSFPATWTLRTAATSTTDGIEYRVCTRAGCTEEETRAIPATGSGTTGGGGTTTTPSNKITAPTTAAGWTDAVKKVNDLKDGSEFTIDMKNSTTVSGDFLEAIAGKDVSLTLDIGGGFTWTVNGKDIPQNVDLASVNLGVAIGASYIPAEVRNIDGSISEVQLRLSHDGELPFALTLTVMLDKVNAASFANLFYYNPDSGALEFKGAVKIATDGIVEFDFGHASDYLIVVADATLAPIPWQNPFKDVNENDWFYGAVQFVHENGLFAGTSPTTFSPNIPMTRAMLVTVLWRLEGEPEVEGIYAQHMMDVEQPSWYADAMGWAAREGIISGYGEGLYGPGDPITREQLAVILYRYAGSPELTAGQLEFADAVDVSVWAWDSIVWATTEGIITGKPGNLLDPKGNATRAEVATMLERYLSIL